MRTTRIVVMFCLFAVCLTPLGGNAWAIPITNTLISGNGPLFSPDPANSFSLNGGATFQPAVIIPPNGAYDTIPGTQWISVSGSGYGAGNMTTLYRTSFVLPAGFTGPSLEIQLHADNVGTVLLNGFEFGQQPLNGDQANFTNPPSLFTISDPAHFQVGINLLDIQVLDLGEPSGLDYRATLTFIPEPSTVMQCVVGLLGLGLAMRGKRTR
jgi:hypothetical protein